MKHVLEIGFVVTVCLAACGGREDGDDHPMCFADFPCGFHPNPFVASCTPAGRIAAYETFGCEEVCEGPCSGAGCRQLEAADCPGGTLCVEPVLHSAECRAESETCGGPSARPCPEGQRCVRRASADFPSIECELVASTEHGLCEPPSAALLRCDASGLPIVRSPYCEPPCARIVCDPSERLTCEDACDQRMASAEGYCAACLVDTLPAAGCADRPAFDEAACARVCERPVVDFATRVEPDDLRCTALCEELACTPELAAACQVDCAAHLSYQTGVCALCLTETASAGDCSGGGTGLPRYDLAGCEAICFTDLGTPISSGGAGASCDGLCLRMPACDDKRCDNACQARLVYMPPLCANCLLDHADDADCEAGTSERPTFDYAACLGVCARDTNDPPPLDSPSPELCRPTCEALVCPDRQARCVTDCGARISQVSDACAACIVASLHAVDDCRWAFTPDACNDVCLVPP